jgi:hypothetical protein
MDIFGSIITFSDPYSDIQYPFSHKLTHQVPYTNRYEDVTWNFINWHTKLKSFQLVQKKRAPYLNYDQWQAFPWSRMRWHLRKTLNFKMLHPNNPHLRIPYFDTLLGLGWSNDPGRFTGCSVATGRASHARQVKVMTQTRRDTLALQVKGWAWGCQPHPIKNMFCWKASKIEEVKVHQGL